MPPRPPLLLLCLTLLTGCASAAPPTQDASLLDESARDSPSSDEAPSRDGFASDSAATPDARSADDVASSPSDVSPPPNGDGATAPGPQLPPQGRDALEEWLAAGYYRAWHCEPAERPARAGSAHLANRICSNDLLATSGGTAPFPAGVASVKELYDRVGGTLVGYAVAVKLQADSRNGAGWYWYERVRGSVYADGAGVSLCSGCHSTASSSFAPDARDFVFTRVP